MRTKLGLFIFVSIFPLFVTAPCLGSVTFKVDHSQAADVYVILDQLSLWSTDECEPEYRNYWKNHFGLSAEDEAAIAEYKKFRIKHTGDGDQAEGDPRKNRNGFFAKLGLVTADPVGEAFFSSSTLERAYQKLAITLSPEELSFLKGYHERFRTHWKVLLEEMEKFGPAQSELSRSISKPKIEKFFGQVSDFYRVKKDIDYRVHFIWWPPMKWNQATAIGRHLFLFRNPEISSKEAGKDSDIVFHEVVHSISTLQDLQQKQNLTRQFLDICDLSMKPANLQKVDILEEPLAVAFGQIIFWERFDHSRIRRDERLKKNPYISLFGKLVAPLADDYLVQKRTISDGFVPIAARLCQELLLTMPKLTGI